ESGDDAQYSPESLLRFRLQCIGNSNRRRRAVPFSWMAAQPDDRWRGNEFEFFISRRKRASVAPPPLLDWPTSKCSSRLLRRSRQCLCGDCEHLTKCIFQLSCSVINIHNL